MKSELINFYRLQRIIFGVCPCCNEIFRLSDGDLSLKKQQGKALDWMSKFERADEKITNAESRAIRDEEKTRDEARKKGRREATDSLQKLDRVFYPHKLEIGDAKLLCDPVDYLVFNGMKKENIKNLIFMDSVKGNKDEKALQKNIETIVDRANYEWITMQVNEQGEVSLK